MQSLARYVFISSERFAVGEFVTWHVPLDGRSETMLKHILLAEDPCLRSINGPFGNFNFIQIVGVFEDEMKAAQKWNGHGRITMLIQIFSNFK